MTYSATLTNAGAALYAAALVSGTPIQLATMAVGDGGGSPVVMPDPTRTTLVNQVYATAISNLTADATNPNLMWAEMIILPTVGGWTVREVGIFTSTGTLFAIANFPDTIKPALAAGSTQDLVINFGLAVSNTALIAVTIDPSSVSATHAWVLATVTAAYLFPGGTQYQVWQKHSAASGDGAWADPQSPWQYPVVTTGGTTNISVLAAYNKLIQVTGALIADATLSFPAQPGKWTILNETTGGHNLIAIAAGGTGVAITQGMSDTVHFDGANLVYSHADGVTRPQNDNSKALATTAYADRVGAAISGYYQDTGAANAFVIAPSPAISAYADGMSLKFRAIHACTGPCTVNAGPGAIGLVRSDGMAMQSGDVFPGMLVNATFDNATGHALMNGLVQSQLKPLFGELAGGNNWSGGQGSTPVPVAYSATITLDMTQGNNFVVGTITGSTVTGGIAGSFTLANPNVTSANFGQSGWICFLQDVIGGHTITTFGANFLPTGGAYPNLTGGANKRDYLYYQIDFDGKIVVGARNNVG